MEKISGNNKGLPMRLPFFCLFVCLILIPAQAAGQSNWTGNPELDAAFVYNNSGRYAEAFAVFSKLHAQGLPMAGTMLGRYYEDGRAVTQDREKALALYTEARNKGDALAEYHYARVTSNNLRRMTPNGLERLVSILTATAEKGNAPVQTALAATYLFLSGAGPELSRWTPPEARNLAQQWMRKAAEAGYAPAQSNMYFFYVDDAREWVEKAAAAGYPPALKRLNP